MSLVGLLHEIVCDTRTLAIQRGGEEVLLLGPVLKAWQTLLSA
jgi:hypothetical protein